MTVTSTKEIDETYSLSNLKKDSFLGGIDYSIIPSEEEQWPVIIIGSSMVGKTLGLLLGYHGVRSISFDRHPASGTHPRAAGLNIRTSEILRQLGLEDFTRDQSAQEFDLNSGMLLVEQLVGGKVLKHLQEHDPEKLKEVTPSSWVWISQRMFETVLGKSKDKFDSTQAHGNEVLLYEEQEDGVIVVVRDTATGSVKRFKTQYIVACDGNRSPTRQKEGIKWEGPGLLRNSLSVSFKSDLSPFVGKRAKHGVIYVANEKIGGGFRLENESTQGLLMVNNVGKKVDFQPGSVTVADAKRYFYDCAGLTEDQVSVEIQHLNFWTMAAYTADRFTSLGGRVFLAGDAAHVMPPTGGLGGNTGIADAHNLAWKLAYVLSGKAAHSLLQSYNLERQPVDEFTVHEAYSRFQNRVVMQKPPAPEAEDVAIELGYQYPRGAFVRGEDHQTAEKIWHDTCNPTAAAGSRFPHVFLSDISNPGKEISSIDLIKTNFVLVTADLDSPWLQAAEALTIQIDRYVLNEHSSPYRDPDGKIVQKCKLEKGGAVLVRPDGFIAWRAAKANQDHSQQLRNALVSILGFDLV